MSSQARASMVDRIWIARYEISSMFPMGVETMYNVAVAVVLSVFIDSILNHKKELSSF